MKTVTRWLTIIFGSLALVLITVAVIGIFFFLAPIKHSKGEQIKVALELARLAELPKSAEKIQVAGTDDFFTCTVWLKFKANKEGINRFIQQSKGLQGIQPETKLSYENWLNIRCNIQKIAPWFSPQTNHCRVYEVPQNHDADYGTVIIDDQNDMVYIEASHS